MEHRYINFTEVTTRSENNDEAVVEGYFAVFDSDYELFKGATESIAKGAFTESMNGDVRALYNHNTDIVLGRTSAGTLELKQDERGLWGKIRLNRHDTDAENAYQRILRGDITGCSFGFEIKSETFEERDDGSVHWTINEVSPLYEVSPCVFPAYTDTSINARRRDFDDIKNKKLELWCRGMRSRLGKE